MSREEAKNDKVYRSWSKMMTRCYDPRYHAYHRYGGRGIIVRERWHTYTNFRNDMWETWFLGATVDRIDNDGHYELNNCRWLSKSENKKPYKYDGATIAKLYKQGMKQKAIGALYGLSQDRISKIIKRENRGETL